MRTFLLAALGLLCLLVPFLIDAHHWWPRRPKNSANQLGVERKA
jgi:hypothetical protein